jgi:hypothetical protein
MNQVMLDEEIVNRMIEEAVTKRTWVELTLNEIQILFIQNTTPQSTAIDFARAIEAKVKEKNS